MSDIRTPRVAIGLAVLLVASVATVWALDGDDRDERVVGVAPQSRPVATTTPPEVLGDVVVRVPTAEQGDEAPAASGATIELHREGGGRPLQVDLLRDAAWIAGGTLDAVLRFVDLPAGPYELQVSWDTGVLVDEEHDTGISASGIERHFLDAREGETTTVRCGERACEVP